MFRDLMFPWLAVNRPLWEGEDEGAGGGGDSGDGGSETGDSGEGKRSSILDFANKGDGGTKDGEQGDGGNGDAWTVPEGLTIPDHLVGDSAEDTLRKLSVAYAGKRKDIGKGTGSEELGTVPESADGYTFAEDPDDPILADLNSEESKPIVDAIRAAALETGIPDKAFSAFIPAIVKQLHDSGLQIGGEGAKPLAEVNAEAEWEAMVKTHGKAGADTIVNQLDTFGAKLASAGILATEEDMAEYAEMVGTARGALIMQKVITQFLGEKPVPPADGVDAALTVHEARAKLNEAYAYSGSDREAKITAAEEQYRKAVNASTPGQVNVPGGNRAVRSSILA